MCLVTDLKLYLCIRIGDHTLARRETIMDIRKFYRHIVLILIISHVHVKCLSPVPREASLNVPSLIFQAVLMDKMDLAFLETGIFQK